MEKYKTLFTEIAKSITVLSENVMEYEVPAKCLFWLRNYTRGRDERPFIIESDGTIDWW